MRAATIWGLWSCWLLAQFTKVSVAVTRASAGLLAAELITLAVHSFGCTDCGPVPTAAGGAASIDLPLLTFVLLAVAVAREWRRARQALP